MNPKTRRVLILITRIIAVLMILAGAISQVAGVKAVAIDMTRVGVGDYYRVIGGLKIIFVAMYLYRPTFKIGFLLLTCIFAGAMATLLSHGQAFFPPAVPLAILWVSTYLAEPGVFLMDSGRSETR